MNEHDSNEHDSQAQHTAFQAQMTANWVAAEIISSKIQVGPRLRYLGNIFRSGDFSLADLTALLDPGLELPPEVNLDDEDDEALPKQETEMAA
jgi:hypothetical protein